MSYDFRNQIVSRASAATDGATHETYKPRFSFEKFPKSSDRCWAAWLDSECDRISQNGERVAFIFFDRGRVGLAVDCVTPKDCEKIEVAEIKRGMH